MMSNLRSLYTCLYTRRTQLLNRTVLHAVLAIGTVAVLLTACRERTAPAAQETAGAVAQSADVPAADTPVAVTVYITETGEKYHRGNCRYLQKSKISITPAEAQRQGYTPCKVCCPPGQ